MEGAGEQTILRHTGSSTIEHLILIEDSAKIHIIVIYINFSLTSVLLYSLMQSKITTENECYVALLTRYYMGLSLWFIEAYTYV